MTRTAAAEAALRGAQMHVNDHAQSPLTAYQRDIWAAGSQAPESPQFNCVLHERLRGGVDQDTLAECTERALHRHETFRLRFGEKAGTPFQWVAGEGIRVSRVDFTQEPEPDIACAAWMRRSMATAVPLTDGGTLVEATLLLESPDVTHLHIKAHHIVADGWTVNRLSHEILGDYARATGAGPEHTGLREPSSYLSFIEEEAAYRAGADGDRDRAFHRDALAGVAPALFTRTAGGSGRGRHSFVVEGPLAERVRAAGFSPFAYLAAMFGTWLTRLHRSEGPELTAEKFVHDPFVPGDRIFDGEAVLAHLDGAGVIRRSARDSGRRGFHLGVCGHRRGQRLRRVGIVGLAHERDRPGRGGRRGLPFGRGPAPTATRTVPCSSPRCTSCPPPGRRRRAAKAGDIVFFKWKDESVYNHAAVVTHRRNGNVYVAQHGRTAKSTINEIISYYRKRDPIQKIVIIRPTSAK
ncbi:condensation domain-containing protein [Streptomyces sp. NPDC054841]